MNFLYATVGCAFHLYKLKLEAESALKLALHFENARRVLGQNDQQIINSNFSYVMYFFYKISTQ